MITETQRTRRGHAFMPPEVELVKLPRIYGQEKVRAEDKIAYLHYFGGPFDFWVTEGGPVDGPNGRDFEFFGYTLIDGMNDCAEWGYQMASDMEQQVFQPRGLPFVIERDCWWKPRPMWECDRTDLFDRHGYDYVATWYRGSPQKTRAEMCRKAMEDGAPQTAAMWRDGRWYTVDTAPPGIRRVFGLEPLPEKVRQANLAREIAQEAVCGDG
jgi:hypothetical protein